MHTRRQAVYICNGRRDKYSRYKHIEDTYSRHKHIDDAVLGRKINQQRSIIYAKTNSMKSKIYNGYRVTYSRDKHREGNTYTHIHIGNASITTCVNFTMLDIGDVVNFTESNECEFG
jgi:hypothetical protein